MTFIVGIERNGKQDFYRGTKRVFVLNDTRTKEFTHYTIVVSGGARNIIMGGSKLNFKKKIHKLNYKVQNVKVKCKHIITFVFNSSSSEIAA